MSLAIADAGEGGQPLVLLPSLGTSRAMWTREQAAWSAARRVLVVEPWGHGESPTPEGPHTLARLGEQVLAALDEAGVEAFDVIGISLGGQLALWLAATVPHRVTRLVAGATAARIGSEDGWNQRIATVRDGGMAAVAELALSRLFSPELAEARPEVVEAMGQVLRRTDAEGYMACCAALRDADLGPVLAGITAPTLLLAGTRDASTPPAVLHDLGRRIPHAQVLELDAGHLLNLEAPDAFDAALATLVHP